MIGHRPRPQWRRHHPRLLRLLALRDELAVEAAAWPASSSVRRAIDRARRAVHTAADEAQNPD